MGRHHRPIVIWFDFLILFTPIDPTLNFKRIYKALASPRPLCMGPFTPSGQGPANLYAIFLTYYFNMLKRLPLKKALVFLWHTACSLSFLL
jgi:hypothetical protein